MESPVLTLVVAIFFAVNVDSQRDVIPPPLLSESTPPRFIRPPSVPLPHPNTPIPTHQLPPRATFSPPRPFSQSPPPAKPPQPALPANKNLSPPLGRQKLNMGKRIGLMFIGVATILQFFILTLLLIRRRQLLKNEH